MIVTKRSNETACTRQRAKEYRETGRREEKVSLILPLSIARTWMGDGQ